LLKLFLLLYYSWLRFIFGVGVIYLYVLQVSG